MGGPDDPTGGTDESDCSLSTDAGDAPGGSSAPADAFGTVANEVRVGILRVLFDADDPRSFSELRDEVGIDDSGRFNYHLGELEGRFVRRTEGGYGLTYAGRRVVGSIHSGIYTHRATLEPVEAGECQDCGGLLLATYEDEVADVTCADCERTVTTFGVPPTLVEGFDRAELPGAFSRWVLTAFQRTVRGFCPDCTGRMRPSVTAALPEREDVPGVVYTCDVCGLTAEGPIGVVVLDHPAVVAFHDEHGIDLRETLAWEVPWLFEDHATVLDDDPRRVRVTPAVDGDRISLVLDGEMSVASVDRNP